MAKIEVKGTSVTVISGDTDIALTEAYNPIEFDGVIGILKSFVDRQ